MNIIEINNLTFEYPGKTALSNINLTIQQGTTVALVGPNGAGKTTLMRAIAGLHKPIEGSIIVDTVDVLDEPREAHKNIAYLSDFFGLYDELKATQCLTYAAWSHDIPQDEIEQRINWALESLDLTPYKDKKAKDLSRGLRQRLAIAQTIISQPKILILDEPASGLDPDARASLSNLITRLNQMGMTLIISSHILSELEDYCTEMVIIKDGKLIEHAKTTTTQAESTSLSIKLTTPPTPDQIKSLQGDDKITDIKHDNTTLTITYNSTSPADIQAFLKQLITTHDLPIISFKQTENTLKQLYAARLDASA